MFALYVYTMMSMLVALKLCVPDVLTPKLPGAWKQLANFTNFMLYFIILHFWTFKNTIWFCQVGVACCTAGMAAVAGVGSMADIVFSSFCLLWLLSCCACCGCCAGVNFTNILWAAFAPKSFCQKFTNPNCKHIKAALKTFKWKSCS